MKDIQSRRLGKTININTLEKGIVPVCFNIIYWPVNNF